MGVGALEGESADARYGVAGCSCSCTSRSSPKRGSAAVQSLADVCIHGAQVCNGLLLHCLEARNRGMQPNCARSCLSMAAMRLGGCKLQRKGTCKRLNPVMEGAIVVMQLPHSAATRPGSLQHAAAPGRVTRSTGALYCCKGPQLDGVAQGGASAMEFQAGSQPWLQAALPEGSPHHLRFMERLEVRC